MKYAVITGSTKGIGRAIAEKLLRKKWYVILNYSEDDKAAEIFSKDNAEYSDSFCIIKMDLSNKENALLFFSKISQITKTIDALILNAGKTDRSPFNDIDYNEWESIVNINLNVPFYLTHLFRNSFSKNGRIIFIGSVCGIYPHSVSPVYGVTKAAVHQMAKELTKFFSSSGVTVNAIAPGFVDTPRQKTKPFDQRKRIEEKTALKRFGLPEEIASLCLEVINNQFINGAVISIDGGYSFR